MSYTDEFLKGLKKRGFNVSDLTSTKGNDTALSGDAYTQEFLSGLQKRTKKKAEEMSAYKASDDDLGPVKKDEEEEKSSFDFDFEQQEYDRMSSVMDRVNELTNKIATIDNRSTYSAVGQNDAYWNKQKEALQTELDTLLKDYGNTNQLQNLMQTKKQQIEKAKREKEFTDLASVADATSANYDKNFAKYAADDSKVNDELYAFINNHNNAQTEMSQFKAAPYYNNAQQTSVPGYGAKASAPIKEEEKQSEGVGYKGKGYHLLTDTEKAIFNYHYKKNGKEKAEQWLDSLQETLNSRMAGSLYENMKDDVVAQILYGGVVGIDQFSSGLNSAVDGIILGKDEYKAPSVTQMTGGKIRENLSGGSGVAYDLMSITMNMAPSMLVSAGIGLLNPAAGAAVGNALFGVSAGGNAYQEGLQRGMDTDQARGYGILVGGSNIVLGKLLGGIPGLGGGSGVFDALAKKALPQVNNGLARFAIKYGANMLDESLEEAVQELLTPVFQRMVGDANPDKTDWGDVAYSALLGGLSAGILNSSSIPGAVKNYKNGIDPVTGLTADEKKVVDKVYESRVAEAEKEGKVSAAEKEKIFDAVVEEMDKGYIDTDTIESVLGGESYSQYDSLVKESEEFNKLYETESGKLSERQKDRLAELKAKNEASSYSDAIKAAKEKLTGEVSSLPGRFAESYNEKARRGQAFEADLTKYNAKQKKIIQKAIDSGILNNTRRTHEFVDMIAKVGADKGVLFDFTNNKKLKESGFAIDGKFVNGYVTKDGITVNLNSAKALNSVVGHEITHVLEGTELYNELAKVVTEYAQTKGEYQSRYDSLAKLYEGIENANVDAELVADLVGDYLFTDSDFVSRLSTENRNVFQKIYDEIKYLVKTATAGSPEAKKLLEVQRAFEKVYKAETKNTVTEDGVKYSLVGRDADGIEIYETSDDTKKLSYPERKKALLNSVLNEYRGRTAKFTKGDKTYYAFYDEAGVRKNLYGDSKSDKQGFKAKVNIGADGNYIELAENALYTGSSAETGKTTASGFHDDAKSWDYYIKTIKSDGQYFDVLINVKDTGNENYVYDITLKKATSLPSHNGLSDGNSAASTDKVAQKEEIVKYSLSDSEGKKLTKDQQEYFKNSKMRDESGNLKPMYHGSQNGGFHVFDPAYSDDGISLFFTDSNDVAFSYSGTSETYVAQNFQTAEDFNRFFAEIGATEYEVRKADGKFHLYDDGDLAAVSDTAEGIYEEFKDWSGLGYGEVNYKVYLNLENPLEVDAKGRDWNNITGWSNAANLKAEDVAVKRVGDEFQLFKGNRQIESMAVNQYTENMDKEDLKSFLINKANNRRAILTEGKTTTRDIAKWAKENGYDGVIFKNIYDIGGYGGTKEAATVAIAFDSSQIKSVANTNPTRDADIRRSLSAEGKQAEYGNYNVYGKDIALEAEEDIAPVAETAAVMDAPVAENVFTEAEMFPDDNGPMEDWQEQFESITDEDAPPETDEVYDELGDDVELSQNAVKEISKTMRHWLGLSNKQMAEARGIIERYSQERFPAWDMLYDEISEKFGTYTEKYVDEELKDVKKQLRTYGIKVDPFIKSQIADFSDLQKRNFGKVRFSKDGLAVDSAYQEFQNLLPGYFPESIDTPTDQLLRIIEVANMEAEFTDERNIDHDTLAQATDAIISGINEYKSKKLLQMANKQARETAKTIAKDEYAPIDMAAIERNRKPPMGVPMEELGPTFDTESGQQAMFEETEADRKITRAELHQNIMDNMKNRFAAKGYDLDEVLKNAKNLSTFATVDNTPQRVMEKALGWKEGKILSDLTVDQTARNESEGIRWLNSFTDRKKGVLAQISKKYNIKPGSKESKAAQMYAEGFYVAGTGKNGEFVKGQSQVVAYGDRELALDFPDAQVQKNIKALAKDPQIRQIYDATLEAINKSRKRNAYPEIPRLDNYFLHFRSMEDTFSRLGLPFNPNDIKAKDLPTDLNGVTADLKPGQPYFASAKHREGITTSYDLLGGMEMYLSSAKNQIYHIDDIQALRALRNYIADGYGQAKGLDSIDSLSEEEAQQKIEQVFNSHLSTFAKFLNEEANMIAGKTALIDRGLEGIIGRRGMTFLDTLNRQVGANMVGFNVSSSMTNFLSVVQATAKTNKFDVLKAFAQTVASKVSGKPDAFIENNPTVIRRKGAERFHRNPWQKATDAGYVLMSAVDNISTELIVRAKYNELTRKGMSEQEAIMETDKWVSRMMGDRSLGQQPQLYNSKMLGLVTKFQLEVRNQLDAMVYDTIQEAKESTENIPGKIERNAKKAAKITSTFVQLAVAQHLFGKAFESVAGYNPAFDIISAMIKAFGWDDEEESEDTVLDNIDQGFMELLGDLPYTSTLTGGRIPIANALPIEQFITGKDSYGNEKNRRETLAEAAPYYLLPGGYGQAKKTWQGLGMFDDDLPIAGSYTDSGNLRFPVEDTLGNRVQAAIFGQYASGNARDYFDNEWAPLKKNQIEEYAELGIPIEDYRKIRKDLAELSTLGEKAVYIANLDLPMDKKNLLINNIADRDEPIDLTGMVEYGDFGEFEYAKKNPNKYAFLQENGISYEDYEGFDEDTKEAWSWAYQNPDKFLVSKAVTDDVTVYKQYTKYISKLSADKDQYGNSISGSKKEKVAAYINGLDMEYGQKIILFKSQYPADDTYNYDIVDYLSSRDDISYEDTVTILKELGFEVHDDGRVTWD